MRAASSIQPVNRLRPDVGTPSIPTFFGYGFARRPRPAIGARLGGRG